MIYVTGISQKYCLWFTGLIAQWLERRSNKAKIPGSNPGGAYFFTLSTIFAYENNFVAKIRTILISIILKQK